MKQLENPRLGKQWISIGLIRVEDNALVAKKMKQYKIPVKLLESIMHKKDDIRRRKFQEIFVSRGFRREAMKVMKVLFAAPSDDPDA